MPDPERVIVTTKDPDSGEVIGEQEMGPDSTYVIVLGPDYYLAHEQIYPKSGTIQITLKRHD